jgi:hypothetical protein
MYSQEFVGPQGGNFDKYGHINTTSESFPTIDGWGEPAVRLLPTRTARPISSWYPFRDKSE